MKQCKFETASIANWYWGRNTPLGAWPLFLSLSYAKKVYIDCPIISEL